MLQNLWNESEASKYKTLLEQRVYSSRLLGANPSLVMHGGGNTSVKGEVTNLFGETEPVIYVKGSGWDLATIEAPGFPTLWLKPLLKLRQLPQLSDPEMVDQLRAQLLTQKSPDPSVEALLHAFIPFRFIDHTHAASVLTLTNQPGGEAIIKKIYGRRLGVVPYVMPGFQLAKLCADVFESDPGVEGLVLLKHGVFTFGETAKESYDRMIRVAQEAEEFISQNVPAVISVAVKKADEKMTLQVLSEIRSEMGKRGFPGVVRLNQSAAALEFVNRGDLEKITQRGPVTPDHVIRTKRLPLVTRADKLSEGLDNYAQTYQAYFETFQNRKPEKLQCLDKLPRVILVPEVGAITIGATFKECSISMDLTEQTMDVVTKAEGMEGYEALPPEDIFDVEYWVLEQAKLKLGSKRLPLTGKVALVTGGAGGIGLAITKEYLAQGACVAVLDRDEAAYQKQANILNKQCKGGNSVLFVKTDVARREDLRNAVAQIVRTFGGIDIAVVNAGIFPPSALIESITDENWQKALDINVSGAFYLLSEVLPGMKKTGGDILLIASKNVPAPGKEWAAYSITKAAQVQLARICALENGAFGIRVNMLHPHLVFDTGAWGNNVLESRAKAYGLTVEAYKKNNLLKTEITSADVAKAAMALVGGAFSKTTGAQIPLDGGSDRTL